VNFTRTSSFCAGSVFRQPVRVNNKLASSVKLSNEDEEKLLPFPCIRSKNMAKNQLYVLSNCKKFKSFCRNLHS